MPVNTLPVETEPVCKNCGAPAPAHFCPQCGQSTQVTVPTVLGFIHDGLGAVLSYDHKLWRTLATLVTRPGQLTVDYIEGRRVRYLTPFQLFFGLETITFLAYRVFFKDQAGTAEILSRALLVTGCSVAVAMALLHARRRLRFLAHVVAATHIWAFLLLLLLVEYALVPKAALLLLKWNFVQAPLETGTFLTRTTQTILVLYTARAIQVIYPTSRGKALLKAIFLLLLYLALMKWVPLIPGARR